MQGKIRRTNRMRDEFYNLVGSEIAVSKQTSDALAEHLFDVIDEVLNENDAFSGKEAGERNGRKSGVVDNKKLTN